MSVLALVAIFHRNLVHGKICSCCGVLGSLRGLQPLTVHLVALWVASGNESSGTLEDVNVSGVYALPWIIHHGAAGVRLTGAAPCHLVLVETQKVETLLFTWHLSAVRDQPRVPGPMLSSGISLSSASGSVSDLVSSDLSQFWYSSLLS